MSSYRDRHSRCEYRQQVDDLLRRVHVAEEKAGKITVEEHLDQLDTVLHNIAVAFEELLVADDLGCGTSLESHPVFEVEGAREALGKLHGIVAGLRYRQSHEVTN